MFLFPLTVQVLKSNSSFVKWCPNIYVFFILKIMYIKYNFLRKKKKHRPTYPQNQSSQMLEMNHQLCSLNTCQVKINPHTTLIDSLVVLDIIGVDNKNVYQMLYMTLYPIKLVLSMTISAQVVLKSQKFSICKIT